MHTSGRNSGVIHAGIYYKPNTLKAQVCVEGAKRLRNWIQERKLPYKRCGKIIVPTKNYLDNQLDELLKWGQANGAAVELLSERDLRTLLLKLGVQAAALWSPNTAVVKPPRVIQQLQHELKDQGVHFILNERYWKYKRIRSR